MEVYLIKDGDKWFLELSTEAGGTPPAIIEVTPEQLKILRAGNFGMWDRQLKRWID